MAAPDPTPLVSRPTRREGQDRAGLMSPLLGFLDHNMGRFPPRTRDTIGLGILLILIVYVINGLL
jgi:hypothetical protein